MLEESGMRVAISVGRREWEALTKAWEAYVDATQVKPVDPVLAMQCTGSVLRSLAGVMANRDPETGTQPKEIEG